MNIVLEPHELALFLGILPHWCISQIRSFPRDDKIFTNNGKNVGTRTKIFLKITSMALVSSMNNCLPFWINCV